MKKFQTLMKSRFENAKKDNKGFSLVELIIAVVILGIIAVVAIGGLYSNVTKSRVNTDISNAQSIQSALSTLSADKEVYTLAVKKGASKVLYEATITGSTTVADLKACKGTTDEAMTDGGTVKMSDKIKTILPDGFTAPKAGGSIKLTIETTDDKGNVKVTCKAYSSETPAADKELSAAE